jgi:hypothetical protein
MGFMGRDYFGLADSVSFFTLPAALLCSALFVFPDRFSTIAPVEHVKTAQDFCRLSTKKEE